MPTKSPSKNSQQAKPSSAAASSATPDNKYWDSINVRNEHQQCTVDVFKEFDTNTRNLRGDDVISALQEELSIFQFSRIENLSNYAIFKNAKRFLEEHGVNVPDSVDNVNFIFARVLEAIWPHEDFLSEKREAYNRFLAHRRGDLEMNMRPGATPRELQTPRPPASVGGDKHLDNSPTPGAKEQGSTGAGKRDPNARGGRTPMRQPDLESDRPVEPREDRHNDPNNSVQASINLFSKIQAFYKGEKQKLEEHQRRIGTLS